MGKQVQREVHSVIVNCLAQEHIAQTLPIGFHWLTSLIVVILFYKFMSSTLDEFLAFCHSITVEKSDLNRF